MTNTTLADRMPSLQSRRLGELKGYKVQSKDGEVGKVVDLYFDDLTWTVRYFVVETGSWLDKNRVLVAPGAFGGPDDRQRTIPTRLTQAQIKGAPKADLAKPVSRQYEIELHGYYAWPTYWLNAPAELKGDETGSEHLRSMGEVLGYGIHARDGDIGHVEELIAEDGAWIVRYLVIDTRNWLPGGRKVLISPLWIDSISWGAGKVVVDLTRDAIKGSPEYEADRPIDRTYEAKLYEYFGRTKYWI